MWVRGWIILSEDWRVYDGSIQDLNTFVKAHLNWDDGDRRTWSVDGVGSKIRIFFNSSPTLSKLSYNIL